MGINWFTTARQLSDLYQDTKIPNKRQMVHEGYRQLQPIKNRLGDLYPAIVHLNTALVHLDNFFTADRFLEKVAPDDADKFDHLAQKDLSDYCRNVTLANIYLNHFTIPEDFETEVLPTILEQLKDIAREMTLFMNRHIMGQGLLKNEAEIRELVDQRQTFELIHQYGINAATAL